MSFFLLGPIDLEISPEFTVKLCRLLLYALCINTILNYHTVQDILHNSKSQNLRDINDNQFFAMMFVLWSC